MSTLLVVSRCNIALWGIACMVLVMSSQESSQCQTSDLKFDHISVEQGLSQDIVWSIAQDKQGFMWFATENGLNRYDGYSIKVYKHNQHDLTSLAANDVRRLFLDRSGTLWIIQYGFISEYDSERDAFINLHFDFATYCAYDDQHSHLLLGTDKGLMKLNTNDHSVAVLDSGAVIGKVYAMSESVLGFVWVGTSNGLYRYYPGSGKFVRQEGVVMPDGVSVLLEDSRGRLWLDAGQRGLRRFDVADTTINDFYPDPLDSKSLIDHAVICLFEDSRGNIWVGTFSGLERYDPASGGFLHYRSDPEDPYSLRSNRVYSVFQDRDGAMWIGTYRGGISRSDPYHQKFEHYYSLKANSTGPVGTNAFALLESSSGDLWIGTEISGLARVERNSHRFTSFLSNQRLGATIALEADRKGRLWLATQGTGLVCYDGSTGTMKRYRHSQTHSSSIGEDEVQSLHLDRDGILWVGLKGRGLDRYDERSDSFIHYWPDDRYPSVGVWHIAEDRRGVLWLGSLYGGSGVYCFEKSTGAFTIPGKSLAGPGFSGFPSIRAVYEDSQGVFWLGSWGSGLYRFDPIKQTVTQFTEVEGLVNNFVKGMLADSRENLWITTENGMSKFDPRTGVFKGFTTKDGLQSNFFWSGSFCRGRDGRMYFGGTNGFNAFHPDSTRDNPNVPPVIITRFMVLNEPMKLGSGNEVSLGYQQDFFSFEFVALNYTAPEKNEYAYRMEGFDKEWVKAGTRRYAAYTHLDPGKYTFRVKASNNDGIWNEQGTSLSVVILPPYWRTWWFRLLAILTLAGGLSAAYVYRVRRLLEIERLRSRIAADLHDDVGSEIGHIALASQLLARKGMLPENEQHQLLSIGTSALHASEMMKEVVWLLNPKNDSLQDILLKMKTSAAELLVGIDYAFEAPQGEFPGRVDLKIKRNVFLMYKEILHNIVKHARATRVSIQVQIRPRYLGLTVSDNGIGFDTSAQTTGNGLGNLRNRAAQIGGNLSISSESGMGTTIALNVRI
jgi:ligand-binding sensor domain-containing protein